MIKRSVVVRTRFEGTHKWPEAVGDVWYLRESHRHEFHVEVEVPVEHNDRQVEFIGLKQRLKDLTKGWPHNLGSQSCEDLAQKILEAVRLWYPNREWYRCSVFEEGENGANVIDVKS